MRFLTVAQEISATNPAGLESYLTQCGFARDRMSLGVVRQGKTGDGRRRWWRQAETACKSPKRPEGLGDSSVPSLKPLGRGVDPPRGV